MLCVDRSECWTNSTMTTNLSESIEEREVTASMDKTRSLIWHYTIGYVFPIICAFGILGNVTTILVFTLHRRMFRGSFYVYLKWMAVSDLMASILWLPEVPHWGWGWQVMPPHLWPLIFYYVHLSWPLINWALVSSNLLVVCLTVDRYISVRFPLKAKLYLTSPTRRILVTLAYLVPFIWYLPSALLDYRIIHVVTSDNKTTGYDLGANMENREQPSYRLYLWLREFLLKPITVMVVVGLNASLLAAQYRRGHLEAQPRRHREEFRHMRTLLVTVSAIYCLCLTPMAVQSFIRDDVSLRRRVEYVLFRAAAHVLEIANSALNFYFYCLINQKFRHALLLLVLCHPNRQETVAATRDVMRLHAIRRTRTVY